MNRQRLALLAMSGLLACNLTIPAMASDVKVDKYLDHASVVSNKNMLDTVLYYGTVKEIIKDNYGNITQISMESERYGGYIMNIHSNTLCIDGGDLFNSDTCTISVGESLYVFHSAVSTLSIPPQSLAYVIVRNIPADTMCPQYHIIEGIFGNSIVTDVGGLHIISNKDTDIFVYNSDGTISIGEIADIKNNKHILVWYDAVMESYPARTLATKIVILPEFNNIEIESEGITRAQLAMLLFEKAGEPAVNHSINYRDVKDGDKAIEAISWVTSQGYMIGYDNNTFGPNDEVNYEQLFTILWRTVGSPSMEGYMGLAGFEDIDEVSDFAKTSIAWAHHNGFVQASNGLLNPKSNVAYSTVISMITKIES